MRIGINARLLGKSNIEGVGRYTHELIKNMSLDHPNDAFILYVDQHNIDLSEYGGNVSCRNLVVPPRHPLLWNLWFEYLLPWTTKRDQIDVFFSPEGMLGSNMKLPTVMTTHDLVFERYPHLVKKSHANYLRKNSVKSHQSADHIIAVSNFTKKEIIELYDHNSDKISVIYNGCSDKFYRLNDLAIDSFRGDHEIDYKYLLYLGSLHPRKNIVKLIEGFEQFKRKGNRKYKLVLAGRLAWLSDGIRSKIVESDYAEDIVHLDYFEGDLNALINAAELLIYPSLYEGFGLPVLEAMSAGTPVITSRQSAMSEVAMEAALYVDPEDIEAMASSMELIIKNPEMKERMVQAGLKRSKDFDWKSTARQTYDCLTKVLNG